MKYVSSLGLLSVLSCGLLLSACGSSTPPPPPPVGPTPPPPVAGAASEPEGFDAPDETPDEPAAPAEPAAGTRLLWGRMSYEHKLEYMKAEVMPEMGAVFRAHDAEHYKSMNCMSCHGAGAKERKFAMPSDSLPKLTTDGTFAKERKEHPKGTQFMMAKVVPSMAALLDAKPYDPKTKQGFGCFGCHVALK